MPTDAGSALFLFAHQDDEFGVYQRIAACRAQGLRVRCAYLTDGATPRASAARRNAESLAVLAQLGVAADAVRFAGDELAIGDNRLLQHLPRAAAWLAAWLDGCTDLACLHVPAWEGGHPDHDALHALAVRAAARRGLLDRTRQYSLYHGRHCPGPLFKVLDPIPENGPAERTTSGWGARLRRLRWYLSYPSQRITWLGLFPFVLWHELAHGTQALQPVALDRLDQRPHAGPLYYEKRGFASWAEMRRQLDAAASTIA